MIRLASALCASVLASASGPLAPRGIVQTAERPPATQRVAPAPPADSADRAPPASDTGVVRTVRGRIIRPAGHDVFGVPGVWVVLHRVGPGRAGPLDSLRSGPDGGYHFRYRASGSDEAVYFVSAQYGGVAYFSSRLRQRDVRGDDAEVAVFDTTSRPITLRVAGRHVVVSSADPDGSREIVEVYELSNDSTVTVISPDDARPTWSTAVPEGATAFRAGQGDVSASAVRLAGGRVSVIAPFAPGVKQVSFAYRLPRSAFPLSVPLLSGAEVFEVLLEDSAATASGARLRPVAPVAVEGRTFRRYLANDTPPNSVARITVPVVVLGRRSVYVAVVVIALGAAMLVALARTFARPPTPVPAHQLVRGVTGPPHADADEIARQIVALDRDFETRADAGPADRAAYESTRDELKQRLARALATTRGAG